MEDVMKTAATVLTSLLIAATAVYAQVDATDPSVFADLKHYSNVNTTKATQNYLGCLRSSNEGVIESALAQVAMMKLAVPEGNFRDLEARVAEIARASSAPELRYKAYLVATVLAQPEIFKGSAYGEYGDTDGLFGALASRLCAYCMK